MQVRLSDSPERATLCRQREVLGVIGCNDPEHSLYLEHSAQHEINKFRVIRVRREFDSRRLHFVYFNLPIKINIKYWMIYSVTVV